MKKRLFAVLSVAAMLACLLVPTTAYAQEDSTPLNFGEEVTVTLGVGETKWYSYTPTASGVYSFVSSEAVGVDPVADLYDSTMTLIINDDDSEAPNFKVTAELNAGETYYLAVYEFNQDEAGSYTLVVDKSMPTDIFFDEYSMESFVGETYTINAHTYPGSADSTVIWTSSNESVATVDENGTVTLLAAGEVCITGETLNGLTDSCWFTVYPVSGALELNKEKTITCLGEETRADTQRYFTFVPAQTGYYCLRSYDIVTESDDTEIDPRAWVYDSARSELAYDDDGGEEVNARVDVALQVGVTYYFMVELYDSNAVGSYKIILEELETAESVSIDCGDLVMTQGDYMDIYITFAPAGVWQEDYTVTSSDSSVVKVDGKTIYAIGEGEATVSVTTDLGLTDSISITVNGVDEIELDTTYTLEGIGDDSGAFHRYAFKPAVSGIYTITSGKAVGDGAHVYVVLCDESNQLRYNDTQSDNFKLTYALKADTTYYYVVNLSCDAEESSVSFMLTKENDDIISKALINNEHSIDITNPGDGEYFVFKPQITGLYAIYASAEENSGVDTKVDIYDSAWSLFYSDDDSNGNGQFRVEEEFIGGETYYIKPYHFSDDSTGSFNMYIEPMFEIGVQGDVNGDGNVTAFDALLTLQQANGEDVLSDEGLLAADINGDGSVTAYDALVLLQMANSADSAL